MMTEPASPAPRPSAPADRAAVLREAADAIDAETRQAKADQVLEPDQYRPYRDASAQLRRMADEPAGEEASTAADAAPPPLPALLARLIADGRHHAYAAAHSKAEELARSHEGFAAGFHVAAVYVADLIATGRVRADQQIRAEDEVAARRVADIPSADPAQWARAIGDAIYGAPAERTHIGGNAEDCPGCHGTNPPYPFICPGPDEPTA